MKTANFVIEILEDESGRKYILRLPNGHPIKQLNSAEDIATFFNEFKFENASENGK